MKKERRIFDPQKRYKKEQRRNKVEYVISVIAGVFGIVIFTLIFIIEGIASVEKVSIPIDWYWYAVGGALILYAIIISIWKVFWLQAFFSRLKKRWNWEGDEKIVVGVPLKRGYCRSRR